MSGTWVLSIIYIYSIYIYIYIYIWRSGRDTEHYPVKLYLRCKDKGIKVNTHHRPTPTVPAASSRKNIDPSLLSFSVADESAPAVSRRRTLTPEHRRGLIYGSQLNEGGKGQLVNRGSFSWFHERI